VKQVVDLQNNEGTVITEENGQPVAIYKDEQGKIHKLSPICTHKGCTVNWNNQTKEWICPCHGATFTPDGHVTSGPAQKDLTEI
jgi:Rieske Fe-S protein